MCAHVRVGMGMDMDMGMGMGMGYGLWVMGYGYGYGYVYGYDYGHGYGCWPIPYLPLDRARFLSSWLDRPVSFVLQFHQMEHCSQLMMLQIPYLSVDC